MSRNHNLVGDNASHKVRDVPPRANSPLLSLVQPTYRGRFRSGTVPPCLISRNDLRRLYTDLDARAAEALAKHISSLVRPPDWDEETWNQTLEQVKANARLTITIQGIDGEQIVAQSVAVLSDDQLPDRMMFVRFDSAAALQAINVIPIHRFFVHLDFTEPPTFATYNPWSQPTPNASQFEVMGSDETWVVGVYESIFNFFKKRRCYRKWLHSQRTFNLLHWLVGIPAALWITYRMGYYLPKVNVLHATLLGAIYVYVFLLALLIFRGVIWGFRWLFPVIEVTGSRPKSVRAILSSILSFLLLALLYDVLKAVISGK